MKSPMAGTKLIEGSVQGTEVFRVPGGPFQGVPLLQADNHNIFLVFSRDNNCFTAIGNLISVMF